MALRLSLLAAVSGTLAIAAGCIVITADGDHTGFGPAEDCPRECINPFDASCWHDAGGCAHVDSDGDGDEVADGTDPLGG